MAKKETKMDTEALAYLKANGITDVKQLDRSHQPKDFSPSGWMGCLQGQIKWLIHSNGG